MSEQVESMKDYKSSADMARYWDIELNAADDEEREWRDESEDIVDRYRAGKEMSSIGREKKFNILWSNTETLKGALFARMAKPDIRSR